MQDAGTVLEVLRERGRKGLPCDELYRQMFNKSLYLLAYGNIYSNQGAMTPGASDETADDMSEAKIDQIIALMRAERYRFAPVRRVLIPKKNGKLRPLGLPSWPDKLAGEVVRLLLEAYYEPQFSGRSHGFRKGRGCHTALREIQQTWTGTTWFIEGDSAPATACAASVWITLVAECLQRKRRARSPISDAVRPDEPQHTGIELCGVAVEHVVGCARDGQPIRVRHQLCQAVGHRLDVRRRLRARDQQRGHSDGSGIRCSERGKSGLDLSLERAGIIDEPLEDGLGNAFHDRVAGVGGHEDPQRSRIVATFERFDRRAHPLGAELDEADAGAGVPDQQFDHLSRPGRDADAEQREGRRLEQHQCAEKFWVL